MAVLFNSTTNITNITINLSNIGRTPVFNVFFDLFDNTTYANNGTLSFLSNGESAIYKFNITNSSNTTLFTAIADFDNLVDESNESNNIAQNTQPQTVSLAIESISAMHSSGTLKIFEFVILNDGSATVTNVQWQFDTNNSNVINSTSNISSLAVGEKAFVYAQYNFSSSGNYNVRANATGISQSTVVSSSLSSSITTNDVAITSFSSLNRDGTNAIFEIQAINNMADNLTNLNWSLAAGDGAAINSAGHFAPVQSNETIFIFVNYDYGDSGMFNPIASVTNGISSDSKSITFEISHILANSLAAANESGNERIFEFMINNTLNTNLTDVSWVLNTKDSNVINSTSNAVLQPSEQIFVYIGYNFTSAGIYNVNATARNGTLIDSRNLTITLA